RSAGATISTPEHHRTALEIAEQGIVLLKNEKNALPMNAQKLKNVLVIGPNADKRFCLGGMGGSSWMESTYEVTVLQGIKRLLGEN
ncbi:glycoside hydrolase family 3 C-terminal domain-containing protein, partial [Staphylococcus aureus]|nr:glycoside hydrolase family 3 C-terminal domain-containing protein [Staphylococcus aureus]